MSIRAATYLAWALCALSLALTALSLLLLVLNLSHPNTHIYAPWLDNTVTTVFFSTVGALVASRRPENPVGWLLQSDTLHHGSTPNGRSGLSSVSTIVPGR